MYPKTLIKNDTDIMGRGIVRTQSATNPSMEAKYRVEGYIDPKEIKNDIDERNVPRIEQKATKTSRKRSKKVSEEK